MPSHTLPGLALTSYSKRSRSAIVSHLRAVTAYNTMVNMRSLFLIDDDINIDVLNGGRKRLELPHVVTSHDFDKNPCVLIESAHLAACRE